jgi:hypothetical protein
VADASGPAQTGAAMRTTFVSYKMNIIRNVDQKYQNVLQITVNVAVACGSKTPTAAL